MAVGNLRTDSNWGCGRIQCLSTDGQSKCRSYTCKL